MQTPPKALTIAGSDSGGGAGIQADLKSFSALGVYGASAITGITAQNTTGVQAVEAVSEKMVRAQIASVLDDIEIGAIKIGMLGTPGIVRAVAEALGDYGGPVVLDPVMVAKSGDPLLADEAVAALIEYLLPHADVLTPNLPEAARLLQTGVAETTQDAEAQGQALRAMGAKAVLVKGGHGSGDICVDLLIAADGTERFEAPRIHTGNTHGTGCSMSSAIAAGLASGLDLRAATARAHGWLQGAIRAADGLHVGQGHGPVHHFHEVWS
ncbi:bifunctional hydroxymethylpyrimidine kinase/phosphomethylpyrimidine kinase [Roseovarius pacificus]|uniref:bifunctional hydroxymethylpyrimidine kinase/phosphomethylpyrimidine kinase n=1 Tax=Roseovarius pacificus TaxID=337701 RepID=UPI002A18BE45|nr:bifunctional hydroxymethylpyrimidine kinase/phosphomethylpyrimidine kinase [Roseovarius pacificus]